MPMEIKENVYGLSEGVYRACLFLGLKFPSEVPKEFQSSQEHIPSDYFGAKFKLNETILERLCTERKLTTEELKELYKKFTKVFLSQKPLKRTATDLAVYFCDYILFAKRQGSSIGDYFVFEFYKKSFELRSTFRVLGIARHDRAICNEFSALSLLSNKSKALTLFGDFIHRDWIYPLRCTFEEFKFFVGKHPRIFSKLSNGDSGRGAEIISVDSNKNLEQLFTSLQQEKRVLEEIIVQHDALKAFCPDSINTIRVNTLLDMHNVVHILTANGRFGRVKKIVDNFHGGGMAVAIDPKTGIIISDAINGSHERMSKHPDTGKIFKGFQYPCWNKVRSLVKKVAKRIPQLRYVGWDIAINDKSEVVLVEANGSPGLDIQQAADDLGRRYLYDSLITEMEDYKKQQMRALGYRVNNINNFATSYDPCLSRSVPRLKFAMENLVPNCKSLLDLGCRKSKLLKKLCPSDVKYYPVDYKKHDDETILCNFNEDEFPDIRADTCFCAFTAEYVENLPQFLDNMCRAARRQILMMCRPIDKERYARHRWRNPFLTDFTEEFLIKTLREKNFRLKAKTPAIGNSSIILYDFRRARLLNKA